MLWHSTMVDWHDWTGQMAQHSFSVLWGQYKLVLYFPDSVFSTPVQHKLALYFPMQLLLSHNDLENGWLAWRTLCFQYNTHKCCIAGMSLLLIGMIMMCGASLQQQHSTDLIVHYFFHCNNNTPRTWLFIISSVTCIFSKGARLWCNTHEDKQQPTTSLSKIIVAKVCCWLQQWWVGHNDGSN